MNINIFVGERITTIIVFTLLLSLFNKYVVSVWTMTSTSSINITLKITENFVLINYPKLSLPQNIIL